MARLGRKTFNTLITLSAISCMAIVFVNFSAHMPESRYVPPNRDPAHFQDGASLWGRFYAEGTRGYELLKIVDRWVAGAMLGLFVWGENRLVTWHARRKQLMEGRCRHCGYDLRASPDRCPECGALRHEKISSPSA